MLIILLPILSTFIVLNRYRLKNELVLAISQNNHYVDHLNIPAAHKAHSVIHRINEATTIQAKMNHNTAVYAKTANIKNDSITNVNHDNKLAILTFGDIHKSQYTVVKPILDQYGFKGSFFVTCNFVNDSNDNNGGTDNGKKNETQRMELERYTGAKTRRPRYRIERSDAPRSQPIGA